MLILTRRVGEVLIIGDIIRIIPLGIKGNQVRLGIEAPKEIPVHRQEINERIKSENKTHIDSHREKLKGEGNE